MFNVTAADALKALKRFKRLAKQDLLASELTSEPDFWRAQAEARRATYDTLMQLIEEKGVDAAHRYAVEAHAALPLSDSAEDTASVKGRRQALEMFFAVLGLETAGGAEDIAASADEQVSLEANS